MFRDQVHYQSRAGLLHSRDRRDRARRPEVFGWMLLVVLAFDSILSFYLLWLIANGGCGPYHVFCNNAGHSLTDTAPASPSEGAPEF
jgi:hypothetical protein